MRDQATTLRHLVLHAATDDVQPSQPAPRLLVLAGGKGGVGTTTLAVNLSAALAQQGHRVVLVDADLQRSDVAALCGLTPRRSLADVLQGRSTVRQVLQTGPAGIRVVPGTWAPGKEVHGSPAAYQRLIGQVKDLGPCADLALVDLGKMTGQAAHTFWKAADQALMVTTGDAISVMDTYAAIKLSRSSGLGIQVELVASQVASESVASQVHARIARSCQHFLGLQVARAGYVPMDGHVTDAAESAVPVVVQSPRCPAARAIECVAARIAATAVTTRAASARSAGDASSSGKAA